jgi:hypothetical protein
MVESIFIGVFRQRDNTAGEQTTGHPILQWSHGSSYGTICRALDERLSHGLESGTRCGPVFPAPVGFHIRHLAGSIDRLITYAAGESLSEEQFQLLKQEQDRALPKDRLFELLETSLQRAETFVREVQPAQFPDLRYVGRKRIPATLAGLLIHIAEHTQRHVGSAIITAKLARGQNAAAK